MCCLTCRQESIRIGFMLSQGGEFAFVLLSLAKELKVLPDELNRLLIIVVVLSMALTPTLADLGKAMADRTPSGKAGALPHNSFSVNSCTGGVSPARSFDSCHSVWAVGER